MFARKKVLTCFLGIAMLGGVIAGGSSAWSARNTDSGGRPASEIVATTLIEPLGFQATYSDGYELHCDLWCYLWIDPVARDMFTKWIAAVSNPIHEHPFLVCTRSHESSHNGPLYDDGYGAINPSGTYRGAYQFSRSTWNNTANHAGRPDLVGVDPAAASVADQDAMALHLYEWQGNDPWLGRC